MYPSREHSLNNFIPYFYLINNDVFFCEYFSINLLNNENIFSKRSPHSEFASKLLSNNLNLLSLSNAHCEIVEYVTRIQDLIDAS